MLYHVDSEDLYLTLKIASKPLSHWNFQSHTVRRALLQFPNLESINNNLHDDDLVLYAEHLKNLNDDTSVRFNDLLKLNVLRWVTLPFEDNVANVDICLQENLIELQNDEIVQARFKDGKHNLCKSNDTTTQYLLLWEKAQLYVTAFTAYLVESGFTRVTNLLSKDRNRLDAVHNVGAEYC
ncbi:uncharacterized protein LOC115218268 [Octopus sinensis]|uniref:Uncharacterized protein LOC115218268 n=1 Tax=Octopus sinensis TaxID=2607531 RepID=A0A6P7T0H8_9MOLL|nr:uncharacterized protein LOC115218268 [Octopus sinensis]